MLLALYALNAVFGRVVTKTLLVDFECFTPPQRLRCSRKRLMEEIRLKGVSGRWLCTACCTHTAVQEHSLAAVRPCHAWLLCGHRCRPSGFFRLVTGGKAAVYDLAVLAVLHAWQLCGHCRRPSVSFGLVTGDNAAEQTCAAAGASLLSRVA